MAPLHDATGIGDLYEVTRLVTAYPHTINTHDDSGYTPVQIAAFNDRMDILTYLLESGADINAPDSEGDT